MFSRKGWLAVSAIWTILILRDLATGGVLYSGKNPRENRGYGQGTVVKNSLTLTERNGQKIYMNQLELGSSQVSGESDASGIARDLASGKSGIKKNLGDKRFYKRHDFYSSALNFKEEKLPHSIVEPGANKGHGNGEGRLLEAKKYAEHKRRITQLGTTEVITQRGKRDATSFEKGELNLEESQLSSYEEDSKSNKYEEPMLTSNDENPLSAILFNESSLNRKSFDDEDEEIYLSVGRGSGKLKDKSNRAGRSGMVDDRDESQKLGSSDKKMHSHERFVREDNQGDEVEKELDAKESVDFVTVASGKAQIVGDEEQTGKSFNDYNADTGTTENVSSDSYSYGVSDDQRKAASTTSPSPILEGKKSTRLSERGRGDKKRTAKGLSPEETAPSRSGLTGSKKNDDYSISDGIHPANIEKGGSGPSGNCDEINADFQGTIKCIGKTKFNKKLPIGLSAVNYAGYIDTERSDSNMEGNPVPKYEREEPYRSTDVARDMRREGNAAVAVANKLAYSETGSNGEENPGSVVRKIGVNDDGEIGLVPAPIPKLDISGSLISHTPAVAIQSEFHVIRENSDSQLIRDELLTTSSWEETLPRGEIPEVKSGDLLGGDERLWYTGETVSEEILKNKKFEASENRDIDSAEVIGGDDHVGRKSLRKKAAVHSSVKENEHLGIIETLNGEFLRDREKGTVNEDKDRNKMRTTLNTRATGTVRNSLRYKNERSRTKKEPGDIEPVESSAQVNAAEIYEEENLRNGNKGGDGSLRIRIPNFLANRGDADIGITRQAKTELLKTVESPGYGNDTDEFKFIVRNPGPIQGSKIERNEDVEGAAIDVRGKSSGNLLSGIPGDGKVIRNSTLIVRNPEKLRDKVNRDENSPLTEIKIDKSIGIEDTREKLTAKRDSINLTHVSPLFQSYTEVHTTGYTEININTSQGRTAMAEPSARNGITQGLSLTVNLLGGKKNHAKLRGEVNRGGTVSRTMGKKETNLLYKLWDSKPEVVNLSALDISGYVEYPTRSIYFEVDTENNDRAKLPDKIAARPEVLVVKEEKQTFPKLKQSRKFPFGNSNNTRNLSQKFPLGIMSDKYFYPKDKRAMKSSGHEINRERMTEKTVFAEESTVSFPPDLEDRAGKAGNVLVEKEVLVGVNKLETSNKTGSIFSKIKATGSREKYSVEKFSGNNTRIFSRSFRETSEAGTPTKSSVQSAQLFPENWDLVSTTENSYQFDNSTEINVFTENMGPLFHGDNAPSKNPAFSYSRKIAEENNETYSNDGNGSMASRKILRGLTPVNSDLLDQDILSSSSEDLMATEIPAKTTLDIFEAITESFNPPFSFNQTDLDNTSRVFTALNQWPVKHSAVVEGDLVLGGLMMVHEREDSVTCGPVMPQGGVQALEAMLYTLDQLNHKEIIPGVKIGAHILDDCDKDTYGLEMAVDFIKGMEINDMPLR